MEINVNKWKVQDIIEKIKNKEIVLPKFQRDFAWTQEQVSNLGKSIKNGFPIGSFTLYSKKNSGKFLLLDGQQRCSSIFRIFENNEELREQVKEYKIPYVEYVESDDKNDDIVQWFVNINEKGTTLDKEDIHIAILSEEKMKKPGWMTNDDDIDIERMYQNKNTSLSTYLNIDDSNRHKVTVVELLYFLGEKLDGFSKNTDSFIMAKNVKVKDKSQLVKRKIMWVKRLLMCLFANVLEKVSPEKRRITFDKKIKEWLNLIYQSQDFFQSFCFKISFILKNFHKKFWFYNIPMNYSSAKKEIILTNIGLNSYMTVYLFNFLIKNKDLIKIKVKDEQNFVNLKQNFQDYQITFLDLANVITKRVMSSGGVEGWFNNLLFSKNENDLFFSLNEDFDENLITLTNNIFNNTKTENKTPRELTKLSLLWFFKEKMTNDYNEYKNGNNEEKYFHFDHTIPYEKVKTLSNCSSLENISILTHKGNQEKSSSIANIHMRNDWINKTIKQQDRTTYKTILKIINKWDGKSRKEIPENEYSTYLSLRRKELKELFLEKMRHDFLPSQ